MHDLKALQYCTSPEPTIQFKTALDDEWQLMPRRPKQSSVPRPTKLHKAALKIKDVKFKHLQELKDVIPKDYHHFYDSLNH